MARCAGVLRKRPPVRLFVGVVAFCGAMMGVAPAAAQSPGPAAMENDRYTVLDYDNGGLLMRSAGLSRTVRAEVSPAQCETLPKSTAVEVLTETQGFGFWMDRTFCRITRVDQR